MIELTDAVTLELGEPKIAGPGRIERQFTLEGWFSHLDGEKIDSTELFNAIDLDVKRQMARQQRNYKNVSANTKKN